MALLRCAVIGVGYLGKFHAQKYAKIPQCELVAVVDSRQEQAEAVAAPLQCAALTDYKSLIGRVDAVLIAAADKVSVEISRLMGNSTSAVVVELPTARANG